MKEDGVGKGCLIPLALWIGIPVGILVLAFIGMNVYDAIRYGDWMGTHRTCTEFHTYPPTYANAVDPEIGEDLERKEPHDGCSIGIGKTVFIDHEKDEDDPERCTILVESERYPASGESEPISCDPDEWP